MWGSLRRPGGSPLSLDVHLDATYRWLCSAQDASRDGGVAGLFDLRAARWLASYPETTGYIAPTFLALARVRSDEAARSRALRMADWEAEIQLADGAVLSGLMGMTRGPAVFNTGQAIFGWTAAFEAAGDPRHAEAARRAARWLECRQEDDGAWRQDLSMLTTAEAHTYNVRCAWALAYAAAVLGEDDFRECAVRNCDWVLTRQNGEGWFADAGFADAEVPLLHTVSYVIEGLVGVYAYTAERRFLDSALRAVDRIVGLYGERRLGGRLDAEWRSTVSWRCPTGEAQIAVVLLRLDSHCPGRGYADVARQMIDDLARMQLSLTGARRARGLTGAGTPDPVWGGLSGSFPVWGSYVRLGLPNWAAKFFLDALLLAEHGADEPGFPPLSPGTPVDTGDA